MIRKPVFFGLMIVLIAALVYLVIAGRRKEQAQAKMAPVEIVRNSPGTPVRLLSPAELRVVDGGPGTALQLQNSGAVAFRGAMLTVTFYDRRGAKLGSRELAVSQALPPGQTVTLTDPGATEIPEKTVRRTARVVYAVIGDASPGT